jgi:isoleucyl-tRNA synthetase
VIKNSGADILRLWVAASDYSDDLRIGPEILKNFVETYRKMRNTLRWMLGTLAHYKPEHEVAISDMPELERYMLHQLTELDVLVRKAYAEYDYKRVVSMLAQFMNTELSAFYFDIRKDALYCDAPSSQRRRAALTCVEHIFRCVTTWLAPIIVFTAEEAWLARYPSEDGSVHIETFVDIPAEWRAEGELIDNWEVYRNVRRVVTGALEIERAAKRIGSSLEAAPIIHVANLAAYKDFVAQKVDFAELCITSAVTLVAGDGPVDAFRLPNIPDIAVVPARAEGRKCARSWRITTDVGSDPAYPELSARDAAAMREIEAA